MRYYITEGKQSVDEICYLVYGENYIAKIPQVLDLNPQLNLEKVFLPPKTKVKLPDDATDFQAKKIVRLFS